MKLATILLLFQIFPSPNRVDLNRATKAQLMTLEDINSEIADKIIKGRPYKDLKEVQTIVPKEVWEKIKYKVVISIQTESEKKETEAPAAVK